MYRVLWNPVSTWVVHRTEMGAEEKSVVWGGSMRKPPREAEIIEHGNRGPPQPVSGDDPKILPTTSRLRAHTADRVANRYHSRFRSADSGPASARVSLSGVR